MIRVIILAILALYALAGAAMAADLPSRRRPPPAYVPPPPVLSWTGFYAGLNIGGGWSAKSGAGTRWAPFTDPAAPGSLAYLPASRSGQAGGVVGGGQFGYNFQANPYFVLGAEADMHGTGVRSGGGSGPTLYPSPFTAGGVLVPLGPYGRGTALNWFGTVRGRAGFLATPTLLIYGTGGFAYGGVSAGGYNATRTGWTAGGGAEWAFHPNWSAKLEYKYVDLSGGNDGSFGYGHRRQSQYNVVTAGVNYRFNFAGPAPVAARY